MLIRIARLLLTLVSGSLGVVAAMVTAPEMKAASASVKPDQQLGTTVLIAGFYFLIAGLAFKDILASGLLALPFTLVLTPVLALLVVFSGWSEHSSRNVPWLLAGIAGNVILFVVGALVGFLYSAKKGSAESA